MADAMDVTGHTSCTVCGDEGPLKCCPCGTTRYCSKACQAVDWKQRGHKATCEKIRAEREEAKRSEAATRPSSPKPERPVFYGPAERTYADEERARIKANFEAARAWREANPEPEPLSARCGNGCGICGDLWDVNNPGLRRMQPCCCQLTCASCADRLGFGSFGGAPCPFCRSPSPKNHREFVARLQRHADNDVAEAIYFLGCYYFDGLEGFVKSTKKARKLFERAADLGNVDAMEGLGRLYEHGATGVKVNKTRAAHLERMAADRGHALAQHNLANRLHNAEDFGEAARFYGLAAAQGHTDSQHFLGDYHERGLGVLPVNLDEAKRLYALAAAKGHEEAKAALDFFASFLSISVEDVYGEKTRARGAATRRAFAVPDAARRA